MTAENGLIVAAMALLFLAFGYLGVPVAFALMAGVIIGTLFTPVSLPSIMTQLFNGIDAEAFPRQIEERQRRPYLDLHAAVRTQP